MKKLKRPSQSKATVSLNKIETKRNTSVFSRIAARWSELDKHTRHWIKNIGWGLSIEFLIVILHTWEPLVNAQNSALDRMMRVNAVLDPAPRKNQKPPLQAFVDVDDATWRSEEWGGGEPYRAPREPMFQLVEKAFAHGARQVVLDIVVEGDSDRPGERADDALFAKRLRELLGQKDFGLEKQLVLVRTLRNPLPSNLSSDRSAPANPSDSEPYLSEVRTSPLVDAVVSESKGRIVVAAPYFTYSSDRVLRDWELLEMVCERQGGSSGVIRILPSVQLAVLAKHLNLADRDLPWKDHAVSESDPMPLAAKACIPFPHQTSPRGSKHPVGPHANERTAPPVTGYWNGIRELFHKENVVPSEVNAYWTRLYPSFQKAFSEQGLEFSEKPPEQGKLENRVVFRSRYPVPGSDSVFETMSPQVLLASSGQHALTDRIVVIGQSYHESGDIHDTPLGKMPGSMVLLNSIDSMARYGLIHAPSLWTTVPMALIAIVLVGYVYARWDSVIGTLISTTAIFLFFAVGSFYVFRYGVWLDFALPLLAIQVHRLVKSYEERIELRELARIHGQQH